MNTYMKYIFLLLICGLVLSSCETSEKDISRQQISTKRLSRIDTLIHYPTLHYCLRILLNLYNSIPLKIGTIQVY